MKADGMAFACQDIVETALADDRFKALEEQRQSIRKHASSGLGRWGLPY